jgi:phosphate transport system substrate-binding protein
MEIEMTLLRIKLLAASAVVALGAQAAQAQVAIPTVELRGAGATTVGDVTVRTLNCVGNPGAGLNQYGTNSGTLSPIGAGHFDPVAPSASNPAYDCATQEIQPNFEGKYIGTGSGLGRQLWRTFTTSTLNGTAGNINPFSGGAGNPSGWPNLQYAFSEAPLPASELTVYNSTANSAANGAGAAIQVPFFVVPIAFAYNPVYGVKTTGSGPVNLTFKVGTPASINGVVAGGLKLSRVAYCKIFNGEITNWNDPLLETLNGKSLRDANNDSANRWASEGVPIRLVGRADRSGGTDVFTRAMAAQCNGLVAVNKYAKASESLPFDNTSTIDIRRLRSDSRYYPASSSSNFSGTVQSLGGRVYDRINNVFCNWNEVNSTTTRCDTALAPGGVFTNSATPGLFIVADGASGVASGINTLANNALLQSANASYKLNGKFGYVGADYVTPVPGRTLFAAALQAGTTNVYTMPSAGQAAKAMGAVLPPQTTATNGAWNRTGDTRQLGATDPYLPISDPVNGGNSVAVSRANPLHWTAILYNPNVPVTQTLAAPASGYPVTGSAFLLTYTCFKPANPAVPGNNAKRFGMAAYMAAVLGKTTKDSTNGVVSPNTFVGTTPNNLGILAQSNIAALPASWAQAIYQTFVIKSAQSSGGQTLGDQNLWFQDGMPTTASDVNTNQNPSDQVSNPGCDATKGA